MLRWGTFKKRNLDGRLEDKRFKKFDDVIIIIPALRRQCDFDLRRNCPHPENGCVFFQAPWITLCSVKGGTFFNTGFCRTYYKLVMANCYTVCRKINDRRATLWYWNSEKKGGATRADLVGLGDPFKDCTRSDLSLPFLLLRLMRTLICQGLNDVLIKDVPENVLTRLKYERCGYCKQSPPDFCSNCSSDIYCLPSISTILAFKLGCSPTHTDPSLRSHFWRRFPYLLNERGSHTR